MTSSTDPTPSEATEIKHIVFYSGGISSWAAAKRVIDTHGKEGVVLLFSDTKMEDEDLYRFLEDSQKALDVPLVTISDGRTPWEVMRDVRFLANTRIDPCSKILKRDLLNQWREKHGNPETTTSHYGLSWEEVNRMEAVSARSAPWKCSFPLADPPLCSKKDLIDMALSYGLIPPRLYEMGFPHNNCGGFCVKAGIAHFSLLLEKMPERYLRHEQQEEDLRDLLKKDVSILRDRTGGTTKPFTLRALRERIAKEGPDPQTRFDWGGCGCAVE